jgi:hypothetical protein
MDHHGGEAPIRRRVQAPHAAHTERRRQYTEIRLEGQGRIYIRRRAEESRRNQNDRETGFEAWRLLDVREP